MKKIVLIVLALFLITGCSSEKPTKNPEPVTKSGEAIKNTNTIRPDENMGITINKIYFDKIETNTKVTKRGYFVEPRTDGYDITICSGEKPSAGYGISVKMIEDNEGKTNIVVEETEPIARQSYALVITHPTTTISIGNNISPDFHVSNSKGDIFPQVNPMISASNYF